MTSNMYAHNLPPLPPTGVAVPSNELLAIIGRYVYGWLHSGTW